MNDVSIAAILPTYKTASVDKTLPLLKVAESQRVFHQKKPVSNHSLEHYQPTSKEDAQGSDLAPLFLRFELK